MEPFTLIEENRGSGPPQLFDTFVKAGSAKSADHDLQYVAALREANPDMILTAIPSANVNLRAFAAAGHANCELDTKTDSFSSWRGYVAPSLRTGSGQLGEQIHFAKYHYQWNNEHFMMYTVGNIQYVLKGKTSSEHALGPSSITDKLILTVGEWQNSDVASIIWVYDTYWQKSVALWKDVQKASWEKVILDEGMKKELVETTDKFFDSKAIYEDLGVPWKRGLIFGGPPGNGKTISVKALAHSLLFERKEPIPTLYVKSAPQTYHIRTVFKQARKLAPCMLVLEDIETIVTPQTRSYFLNEMDGLENNDGLFVVASTNFLDRLDPGLSKRPSRFDRKYIFSIPNEHERTLYCEYWRHKLQNKPSVEFPERLSPAMAHITDGFSFAFLQEAFVATLLNMARKEASVSPDSTRFNATDRDLNSYELWRTFKEEVDILRQGMGASGGDPAYSQACLGMDLLALGGSSASSEATRHTIAGQASGSERGMLPKIPDWQGKTQLINSAAFELR